MADGVVTKECEKLGLGVRSQDKRKLPSKKNMVNRVNSIKDREAGEWVQALQEIEYQTLLLKPLEETRQKLSSLGWRFVEKEEENKKDEEPTTRAQRLREEAVRNHVQRLQQQNSEVEPIRADQHKGFSTSSSSLVHSRASSSVKSALPKCLSLSGECEGRPIF